MAVASLQTRDKLEKLCALVKRKRKILILTHNNPDPDALASAMALQYLFRVRCRVESVIAYGGMVGRAENRAMIRSLKIALTPVSEITIKTFSVIALVDTQPGAGNNKLPRSVTPDIIIDHHDPVRAGSRKAAFSDVRTHYGSTSSILTEYLREAEVPAGIDRNVVTALLYGIKSDTRDLGRGTGPEDMEAFLFLYPRVRFKTLSKIENPELSRQHFKIFERAIKNAVIYRDVVVSDVGHLDSAESLAEMADLLVRLDGIRWSLILGEFKRDIYFSVRTSHKRDRADRIVGKMVRTIGMAGGHDMIAAGKVDRSAVGESTYEAVVELLISRFLKGLKNDDIPGKPL